MTRTLRFSADSLNFNKREALRYAGAACTEEFVSHINSCHEELLQVAAPVLCYRILPILRSDGGVMIGGVAFDSHDLSKNLRNCESVVIMAATLGVGVDRSILAASRTSPARAVLLQGAAAEMIESLCDEGEARILMGRASRPRFSPGYGDLPLDAQKMIFSILSPEKHIGLTLNASLMLSPTKSVTAFVGIAKESEGL